jgi:hypothetical protein
MAAPQHCYYANEDGNVVEVKSKSSVPQKYRATMQCLDKPMVFDMARPSEIKLEGNVRREQISTPIGTVSLRWPRPVELLFGRTPLRATVEATQAVSRALKRGGFPSNLAKLDLTMEIVFLDETLPETQIPTYLVSNCHPGWMIPIGAGKADIYIVGQRVAAGCSGEKLSVTSVADADLARVLIHELGHAVESQLVGMGMTQDRSRAEGFASWFEQYASDFSPVIDRGSTKAMYTALARNAKQQMGSGPFTFTGTAEDYGFSSMYFQAIVANRGIRGLMRVYERMSKENLTFLPAIQREIGWDERRLLSEVDRQL